MTMPLRSVPLFVMGFLIGAAVCQAQDKPPEPPKPDPGPVTAADHVPPRPRKDPPKEYRRHSALRNRADGVAYYEVTEIVRIDDDVQEALLLVTDVGHGTLILETKHSFKDNEVVYSIADAKRKEFVRTSFQMPFASKSRKDVAAESETNPDLKMAPALLTIGTPAGEWRTADSEWRDWPRMRELRYSIRQTVPPFLLEGIERMRGTVFATHTADIFYEAVGRYVVYEGEGDAMPAELHEVTLPPSCAYDKSFGYPCSTQQEKRIKAATESGETLSTY